jgi:hypothetical protein
MGLKLVAKLQVGCQFIRSPLMALAIKQKTQRTTNTNPKTDALGTCKILSVIDLHSQPWLASVKTFFGRKYEREIWDSFFAPRG